MGLSIIAYSKLVPIQRNRVQFEGSVPTNATQLAAEPPWEDRLAPFDTETYYRSDGSERWFQAGSYGSYNDWRDKLVRLAGFKSAKEAWAEKGDYPFKELVDFSDCRGTLGAVASKALLEDFVAFEDKAKALCDPNFLSLYVEWKRALKLAANNGAVLFL